MAKYWEKPLTLRLTAYQRKVLSQIVDGAADAGACKDGLTKLESNALHSIHMHLIGGSDTEPVIDWQARALAAESTVARLTGELANATLAVDVEYAKNIAWAQGHLADMREKSAMERRALVAESERDEARSKLACGIAELAFASGWTDQKGCSVADHIRNLKTGLAEARKEVERLGGEIAEAVETLKFYADTTRYDGPNQRVQGTPDKYQPADAGYRWDVTRDGGKLARHAIRSLVGQRKDGDQRSGADEPAACNHWPGQRRCGVCGMGGSLIPADETNEVNDAWARGEHIPGVTR